MERWMDGWMDGEVTEALKLLKGGIRGTWLTDKARQDKGLPGNKPLFHLSKPQVPSSTQTQGYPNFSFWPF